MIIVRIPTDKNFNYKECKKLFFKCNRFIKDGSRFRDIVENTFFYSFFNDDEFIGCIYFYYRDDKLFVNAFAHRGRHKLNLECLKMTFDWFNCDIYAESVQKPAILCLYRCGFKKIGENLYIKEK